MGILNLRKKLQLFVLPMLACLNIALLSQCSRGTLTRQYTDAVFESRTEPEDIMVYYSDNRGFWTLRAALPKDVNYGKMSKPIVEPEKPYIKIARIRVTGSLGTEEEPIYLGPYIPPGASIKWELTEKGLIAIYEDALAKLRSEASRRGGDAIIDLFPTHGNEPPVFHWSDEENGVGYVNVDLVGTII